MEVSVSERGGRPAASCGDAHKQSKEEELTKQLFEVCIKVQNRLKVLEKGEPKLKKCNVYNEWGC